MTQKPTPHRRLFISAGILGVAVSVWLIANSEDTTAQLDDLTGAHPQCSWPATRGTVTSSELRNHVRANGEDDWQFTVKFAYEVEGTLHSQQQQLREFLVVETTGIPRFTQVPYLFQACGAELADLADAVALFRAAHNKSHFVAGHPVVVYFNPENSDEAVLVPGMVLGGPMTYGETIWLYATLTSCFGSIALLVVGLRRRTSLAPAPASPLEPSHPAPAIPKRALTTTWRPREARGFAIVIIGSLLCLALVAFLVYSCVLPGAHC